MRTLGLSFDFHDSSVAIVENGKLLFASAEERFTRQKHDSHFPFFAIRSALETTQLQINDFDSVVFYESPEKKFSRLLDSSLSSWPYAPKEFAAVMSSWLGSKLWTKTRIAYQLKILPEKIKTIAHHESHALQAFVGSGFEKSAVLVMDAVGEWDSGSTYKAQWIDGKPELILLSEMKFPHSLGLFYSAMTDFLGFKPMNDECTTMALAAFGKPVYFDVLKNLLSLNDEGEFSLPSSHFNFNQFYKKPYTSQLIGLLGKPRLDLHKLNLSSFESNPLTLDEERFVNIAASVQQITEEILLRKSKKLLTDSHYENLCLAGGVALNCVANSRILNESGFKNIYIPPDPGDGGAAIGAAFAGYFQENGKAHHHEAQYQASMGPQGNTHNLQEMLSFLQPHTFQKFRQLQSPFKENQQWKWQIVQSAEELCTATAHLLKAGNIVGWFQGSMELGPRALGQRSILIKPNDIHLAHRLSEEVKIRAPFRPYALSMTPDAADKILQLEHTDHIHQTPMQWMQLAVPVKTEVQNLVRAGIHIDGTTRPQVIKNSHHIFSKLLQSYGALSNLECLLNTSFNEKDYPIVSSDTEALMMFARTSMDVLVINNLIITKSNRYPIS